MSLSTLYLEYGRHVARLRRRRRCGRAYAPTSNTASHDNHEKIHWWVSFSFPYEYGAPLGGPSGRRSSANIYQSKLCSFDTYFVVLKQAETKLMSKWSIFDSKTLFFKTRRCSHRHPTHCHFSFQLEGHVTPFKVLQQRLWPLQQHKKVKVALNRICRLF